MSKMHSRIYGWKHVWMEFAEEYKADIDDPNPDSSHTEMSVIVPVKDSSWSLTYTFHPGKQGGRDFTTVETHYNPLGDFKFTLYPEKWTDGFAKALGMQDIVVGHPEFDKLFIIKGNDEARIIELFQDATLRQRLMDEPAMQVWAHTEHTDVSPSPKAMRAGNQNRLAMRVQGAVDDFERLKSFYHLKHNMLRNMMKIGAADKE